MNKLIFGLLLLVAGVVVGWYFLGGNENQKQAATNNQETSQNETSTGTSGAMMQKTRTNASASGESMEKGGIVARTVVTYTDAGFAPSPVTVKKGTIVTFVNESTKGMWVASGVHPTHQLLPGFDELASVVKGGTYEYTFSKVGTWQYHNHVNPSDLGNVVVTE